MFHQLDVLLDPPVDLLVGGDVGDRAAAAEEQGQSGREKGSIHPHRLASSLKEAMAGWRAASTVPSHGRPRSDQAARPSRAKVGPSNRIPGNPQGLPIAP